MVRVIATLMLVAAALSIGSCDQRRDRGPVIVSAIGKTPGLIDPARGTADLPSRLLLDSIAQGLVRFDAVGQITPGLAERWTVLDNGLSYVFRLRDAEWSDGRAVTAADVVTVLRRHLARDSRNSLRPFVSAIDEVVEMTPQVIEIRLSRPRPDLLELFAQPDLAIFKLRPPAGSGPFRLAGRGRNWVMLRPAFDPARAPEDAEEPSPEQSVQLYGERASRALLRFVARKSDLVTGGTFVDWPLLKGLGIAPANLRIDPAAGLFGLAVVNRRGFLAEAQNRIAITQAIDRAALVAAYAPGWAADETLLPNSLDSAAPPAIAGWTRLTASERREGARARVATWRATHDAPLSLRIALPKGPGATILYGFVGAALRSIGIEPQRVALNDPADLRLIDAVAPYDSARWYLATACAACSDDVRAVIEAARVAPDLASRGQRIAEADMALAEDATYIPIARPLRWSLVALRLGQWQGNTRAWHPLNVLRNERR
ncbi:MAG: ABC transporter substrate-binding protein [Sphingomonas sp.]|nr:ABC transporter substrate-binding protein [Sphingomonas sp.]